MRRHISEDNIRSNGKNGKWKGEFIPIGPLIINLFKLINVCLCLITHQYDELFKE